MGRPFDVPELPLPIPATTRADDRDPRRQLLLDMEWCCQSLEQRCHADGTGVSLQSMVCSFEASLRWWKNLLRAERFVTGSEAEPNRS